MQLKYALHAKKYGPEKAGEHLLAFHGFSQNESVFARLSEAFPDKTIHSFDLFFHGKSRWENPVSPMSPFVWKEIIGKYLIENQIDTFDLAGFSLGGKVVLNTLLHFPDRVQSIILAAPDGVKPILWYRFASGIPAGRLLLKKLMIGKRSLQVADRIVSGLDHFRIVDKSLIRLYRSQTSEPDLRRRIYLTWVLYGGLENAFAEAAELINRQKIPFRLFAGRYDRLMKPADMQRFAELMPDFCRLTLLDTGHYNLPAALIRHLVKEKQDISEKA